MNSAHTAPPPSYTESELQARAEAAAAMNASYMIEPSAPPAEDNEVPPPYENQHEQLRQFQAQLNNNSHLPSAPPPSPEDLRDWYQHDLQEAEQRRLQAQYQEILQNQQRYEAFYNNIQSEELRRRFDARRTYCINQKGMCYMDTLDDFLLMQYMIRDLDVLLELQWRLNIYILETTFRAAAYVLPQLLNLASASMHAGSAMANGINHSSSVGGDGDAGKALIIIAAIVTLFSAAIAGVVGAYYALRKAASSFSNIFHGEKLFASFVRLTATVGGAVSGTFGGIMAGAALGSLIPGFGTLAGAIVGGISGAGITAGLATFIVKHTMRFASWLFHNDVNVISPTNVNKYSLSNHQQQRLANFGSVNTLRIHDMMKSIKIAKPGKSMFDSTPVEVNSDYNQLLKAVKNNPWVSTEGFYFAKKNLFTWNQTYKNWQRVPLNILHTNPPPSYQRM